MPEPRRLESSTIPDAGADRLGQAEALLVDGLDCYFAGRYEDAIHIWTRVLFLDRSHARARAYIDRARTAIAERQRRSEEMLEASQDLLERGRADEARHLLTEAVAQAGDDERAAAVRVKLERLERARADTGVMRRRVPDVSDVTPAPTLASQVRRRTLLIGALAVVLLIAGITAPTLRTWFGASSTNDALAARREPAVASVLSSSDVALVRARTLYGRGRLAEALQALDRIDPESARRPEADTLRVEIQRLLLASAQARPHLPQEVHR